MASEEFAHALKRVSNTTLDVQGAANAWAGSTGLDLVGALNWKAGVWGKDLDGVCNILAGTTGQGVGILACAAAFSTTRKYGGVFKTPYVVTVTITASGTVA